MGSYPKAIQLKDCLLHLGRGQAPAYYDGESNVYAINQKCVRDGAVSIEYARPHDPRKKLKDSSVLQDGDVCINSTGTGTIGRIGLWHEQRHNGDSFFADSHVTIARPDKEIANPKFLASILQSDGYQAIIEKHCFSGSTNQVELNKKALGDLSVYLLDKSSQDVVAEILSTVDQAIEQTEAIIAKQQRFKTGLMQDLLTKGIDENGNIRSEETHEFKDSSLGRIPVEWEVKELNKIVESAVDGPFGSNLKTEHYVDEPGVRVLRLQNIGNGLFIGDDIAWIDEEHAKKLQKHLAVPGDLLIASLGDDKYLYGRACVFNGDDVAIVKADVFRIRLKQDVATSAYISYLFNFHRWRKPLIGLAQGVTRDRVNLTNLLTVILPTPKADEQHRIVDVLRSQTNAMEEATRSLSKLQSLKTALMQDLLTGDVSVANLLDEQSTI